MEIILIEEVPSLGEIGEQVTVKDGYARNYLLPQKLAIPASVKSKRRLEHEKRLVSFRVALARKEAESMAQKLAATSITIARKVGDQDKLFGSVSAHDISRALADEGVEMDRRKIQLEEPLKALGVYEVPVKLPGDVPAQVKIWVVAE
jgi:large subunit ribosomal protein L9